MFTGPATSPLPGGASAMSGVGAWEGVGVVLLYAVIVAHGVIVSLHVLAMWVERRNFQVCSSHAGHGPSCFTTCPLPLPPSSPSHYGDGGLIRDHYRNGPIYRGGETAACGLIQGCCMARHDLKNGNHGGGAADE